MERIYIVVTVPGECVERVLNAIAEAGGGEIGEYTHCAFMNAGLGHFKPLANASPYYGNINNINRVDEWRIETFCDRTKAKGIVQAIRAAHPYEEPVIYIIPLLNEADL
ncbi:MAG: hypothetical protein MUF87_17185 [Anaerolineae bacterium]|nr:hypothetical protein [Anaerolineae bacterium]